MAGLEVVLASEAVARLDTLSSRPRGLLLQRLVDAAQWLPGSGLITVGSAGLLAACEVFAERRVLVVYAILTAAEAFAALLGPELDRELLAREIRRSLRRSIRAR